MSSSAIDTYHREPCATCGHRHKHGEVSGCVATTSTNPDRWCPCTTYVQPNHTEAALTPYAGTSGWSGSETSEARARTEDADGTTRGRQQAVLAHLEDLGPQGTTWKELARAMGWHHGQASGALSVLHKEGRIARLAETRDRCQVYVLGQYVNDRETREHGRKRPERALTPVEQATLNGVFVELEEGDRTQMDPRLEILAKALRRLA